MKSKLIPILLYSILCSPKLLFSQCSFTVTLTPTNVICYNGTSGSITATATGGSAPYQYQLAEAGAGAWASSNVFTALSAGTYPVSVKDATGCIKTLYAVVTQPPQLAVGYTAVDPTCSTSSNGSITVTPTGGVAPYSYSWIKDVTAYSAVQNLTGLSAGNYFLTLTDAKGCTTAPLITTFIKPISLTGFNEDEVADGTNTAANTATTQATDASNGYVFYAAGYSNSSGAAGTSGLPASRTFASAQDASRSYLLAPYSSSNALLIRSSTDASYGGAVSGTLTFDNIYKSPYSTLYVVGTTGSGTGTVDYTVNFADASIFTGSLNYADWFLSAASASTNRALGGLDRVTRASPGAIAGGTDFNLYEAPISIPGASQNKVINSITFSWSGSASARINIFSITGYTSTTSGIRINAGPVSSVTPSVAIASDATSNQFCNPQTVTFTATPINSGPASSYQWKLNGANIGSNSATYTNSTLSNNDQVKVVVTADPAITCLTTTTATSNIITMTVATKVASVSASTPTTNLCSGHPPVIFTATPTNGGTTPAYQWKLNGVNTGTNSPTYTNNAMNNNDQVTVVMTSSIGCATSNPATATAITMSVTPTATPTVSITSVPAITFFTTTSYAGSTPSYQWYKNGTAISGANSSTYFNPTALLGESYSVKLTSSYACPSVPATMSNYITTTGLLLPVTLEYFTADLNGSITTLKWKTSAENQNKQFIIQRVLSPGTNFENIGTVAALNLSTGSEYSFKDNLSVSGSYLYRLVQEDMNGYKRLSNTVSVTLKTNTYWQIKDVQSAWQIQSTKPLQYYLLDTEGKLLEKGSATGITTITKPAIKEMYFIKIICDGVSCTEKLF